MRIFEAWTHLQCLQMAALATFLIRFQNTSQKSTTFCYLQQNRLFIQVWFVSNISSWTSFFCFLNCFIFPIFQNSLPMTRQILQGFIITSNTSCSLSSEPLPAFLNFCKELQCSKTLICPHLSNSIIVPDIWCLEIPVYKCKSYWKSLWMPSAMQRVCTF